MNMKQRSAMIFLLVIALLCATSMPAFAGGAADMITCHYTGGDYANAAVAIVCTYVLIGAWCVGMVL
jgi:hypothetical protein